jgi:hypothetical protein
LIHVRVHLFFLNSNDVRQQVRKEEFKKSGAIAFDGVTNTESTNTIQSVKKADEHMANLGTNYFSNVIKEPKKLEKSKTVFVNLTPRPSSLNLESTEEGKPQQQKTSNNDAFLIEQYKSQFPATVTDSTLNTQLDRTSMFTTNNRTIETPVSAKIIYPKQTQSERLNPIVEEQQNYNCDLRKQENQMLNKKSISYYDNIIRTDNNNNNENTAQHEQQTDDLESEASYSPQHMENHNENNSMQPSSQNFRNLAPQTVENIQHISSSDFSKPLKQDQQIQFPSANYLNGIYDNYRLKDGGLKRYDLNNIDTNNEQEFLDDQMKSIKTYYDGKRCWTSLSNSRSDYDNQNYELNEGYEASQDSLKKCQLYNYKEEATDSSRLNKKSDLHVKIKLPDESLEMKVVTKEKSSGKCRSLCLIVFTFLIFAVVIAILVYFIGLDKYARERLFSSVNSSWNKWTNYLKHE